MSVTGGFTPLVTALSIPRGWLSFQVVRGNPSHRNPVANNFCRNINWILQKKGSQGQASRKTVSRFSFGKCFVTRTSAFSGSFLRYPSASSVGYLLFPVLYFCLWKCQRHSVFLADRCCWKGAGLHFHKNNTSEERENQHMIYRCQHQGVSMKWEDTSVVEKLTFFSLSLSRAHGCV